MNFEKHQQHQEIQHNIEYLYGPEKIEYERDELAVVCLVRNSRHYVKSFVEHYSSLGVKHLVFLDNDSNDGTVRALCSYNNVTILRTTLPYKEYKHSLKRYLIWRFGKDRWCLCADIDELFDYPYSDIVGLNSLFRYLDSKAYTAVVAQMLDMFPAEPLANKRKKVDKPLKESHRFYDISNVKKKTMRETPQSRKNTIESDEVEVCFKGIRDTLFGTKPNLTKFPLVLSNGKVIPADGGDHTISGARVADLTCVLLHYKFVDQHFHKQVDQAVEEENYARNSAKYKMYKEVLDNSSSLQIMSETAQELTHTDELLENQFLVASEDYMNWVDAQERKLTLQNIGEEQRELAEAVLKSRASEREKILRIQQLERRLRKIKQTNRRNRKRVSLAVEHAEKLNFREQRLQKQVDHLKKRIIILENQLENMWSSKGWKVLTLLGSAKAWVLRAGKKTFLRIVR